MRVVLNVVLAYCAAAFKLFTCAKETLLIRGDARRVLNFGLYSVDGIRAPDAHAECLTRRQLDFDARMGWRLDGLGSLTCRHEPREMLTCPQLSREMLTCRHL